MEFHHIGMAVKSIERSLDTYSKLGFCADKIVFDPIQNVNICFLHKDGHPVLELIEPLDVTSPVYNMLGKVGPTPYHLCYTTSDFDNDIKKLRLDKFIPLSKPVPAEAFEQKRICFLYNSDIGLIELVEKEI